MKKKNKEIIKIESSIDLKQELVLVHGINKDYIAMINYIDKNRFKVMNVVGLLRSGLYDLEDALTEATLSKTSYHRLRHAATEIAEKLEELDIDYTKTEFHDLIDTVGLIDRAMTNVQKLLKSKVLERLDGKFNTYKTTRVGEDGKEYDHEHIVYDKPASATEIIKIAEFFDKKKRPDQVSMVNIENNNNNKQVNERLVVEIIEPSYILENLNSDVYDQTVAEIENIERQMKNGDFDE